MEKPPAIPDRRPLAAAEARAFAKAHLEAWRQVPAAAKAVCDRGRPDQRHEIAARFGVWPIANTMNFDSSNPQATCIDCTTGEFCTVRGAEVSDEEVEYAANMACAVDGRIVLRQTHGHHSLPGS